MVCIGFRMGRQDRESRKEQVIGRRGSRQRHYMSHPVKAGVLKVE